MFERKIYCQNPKLLNSTQLKATLKVWIGQVRTGQVQTGQVGTFLVVMGQVRKSQVRKSQVQTVKSHDR